MRGPSVLSSNVLLDFFTLVELSLNSVLVYRAIYFKHVKIIFFYFIYNYIKQKIS